LNIIDAKITTGQPLPYKVMVVKKEKEKLTKNLFSS
jgi:hypothetical protein